MAIKVSVGEQKTQEKPFPKLMKDQDGDIFYFTKNGYGLPFTGSWNYSNDLITDWDMTFFTDYNEPITLQNS